MPTQFIRLNCYGAETSQRRKRHENAFDILDEAGRERGAAPHIRNPQPPNLLFGIPLAAVKSAVSHLTQIARDERGARLRRGAPLLYAVVASYPIRWSQFDGSAGNADYGQWREATLAWLEKEFGAALCSVVEHSDEARPHLHAFVIPPLSPGNRIDHRFHPGRTARAAELYADRGHIMGERAYRDGMRAWQQAFFEAVSSRYGHERVGPRRKRFQRDVALARQASDQTLERLEMIITGTLKSVDALPTDELRQKVELEALADMIANARHEHRHGRYDAIERLRAVLGGQARPDDGDGTGEQARSFDDDVGSDQGEWDDDVRPGYGRDVNVLDELGDPDLETLGHGPDQEDNAEGDPDFEPTDLPGEIDIDPDEQVDR